MSGPDDDGRPTVWLARHGETEWARLGRHTSRTDVPLTATGQAQARALGLRLAGHAFALVLTSPLARATETASLAGFGDRAVADPDLREWDYGSLEGRLTDDIRAAYPGWTIWHGPWPDGETGEQVAARADRVIARALDGRRGRARLRARPPAAGAGGSLARVAGGVGGDVRARDGDRLDARVGARCVESSTCGTSPAPTQRLADTHPTIVRTWSGPRLLGQVEGRGDKPCDGG